MSMQPATPVHLNLMEQWARIICNGLMTMFYGAFCLRLVKWIRNPEIGHKFYLKVMVAFCMVESSSRVYWMVAIYFGTRRFVEFATAVSMIGLGMLFVFTELNASRLESTLMASEKWSRERERTSAEILAESLKINQETRKTANRNQRSIIEAVTGRA